eukprot:21216-Chlamydomonas_euryale.AAC.25
MRRRHALNTSKLQHARAPLTAPHLAKQEKRIGHEYALFYEAHATYNELKGNCTTADQVYNEGIARSVAHIQPCAWLFVACMDAWRSYLLPCAAPSSPLLADGDMPGCDEPGLVGSQPLTGALADVWDAAGVPSRWSASSRSTRPSSVEW